MKKTVCFIALLLTLCMTVTSLFSCELESEEDQAKRILADAIIEYAQTKYSAGKTNVLSACEIETERFDRLVLADVNYNAGGKSILSKKVFLRGSEETGITELKVIPYLAWLLDGLLKEKPELTPEVTEVLAASYQEDGESAFVDTTLMAYSKLEKKLLSFTDLKSARLYVLNAAIQNGFIPDDIIVLFRSGDFKPWDYVTTATETTTKYNWPIDENIANYYYKTNRSTYYALELNYGPAYIQEETIKLRAIRITVTEDMSGLELSEKTDYTVSVDAGSNNAIERGLEKLKKEADLEETNR